MVSHLVRKEILDHLLSLRFLILAAIGAITIWLSLFDGYCYYSDRLADYNTGEAMTRERMKQLAESDWLELGVIGFEKHKAPSVLGIFVRGLEPVQGRSISNTGSTQHRLRKSPAEAEPLLGAFSPLDFGVVTQAVLSLLALLLTFDAVSGEKESGTLRLTGSFQVSRRQLIGAKFLGAVIPTILAFGLPALAGVAVVTLLPDVHLAGSDWLRLGAVILSLVVYLSVFVCAGLLGSCLTSRSATSFVLLLTFWTGSVVVIPRLAFIIADAARPAPSMQEHQAEQFAFRSEHFAEWQRVRASWVKGYEKRKGEVPWATPEGGVTYRKMHIKTREDYHGKVMPQLKQMDAAFRNRYRARVDLAAALGRISPSFTLRHAITALAGTGIAEHQRFEDAFAQTYMDDYQKWVVDLVDTMSFQRADPATYGKSEWDISHMPEFVLQRSGPEPALQQALVDVGWLLVWGLVCFAGAYMRFLRYDVR